MRGYVISLNYAKITRVIATIVVVSVCGLSWPAPARADLASELAKKKALQDSIARNQLQKSQQQMVANQLQNEVKKLGDQINATQATIQRMNGQIGDLNAHINQVGDDINRQTNLMNQEKDKLETTLSTIYVDDQSDSLPFFVKTSTLSDAISRAQDEQAIANEIEQKAKEIDDLRSSLDAQKKDLLQQESALSQLKDAQVQQKSSLDKQASLKNNLLSSSIRTVQDLNNTLQGYQNDLRAVDGRITDFLNAIRAQGNFQAASGDLVVVNARPWHYYQTDPRWADQAITPGDANSDSFAESGCLITSLAQVATAEGLSVNPVDMRNRLQNAGGMYGDLVGWGGVKAALNNRFDFVSGGKEAINWKLVEISLSSGFPVIVHVNKGTFGHWIVVSSKVGDKYAIEDPYFTSGQAYAASSIDYMARLQPI